METTETYEQKVAREKNEKRQKIAVLTKKLSNVAKILGYDFKDRNDDDNWMDSVHVEFTKGQESIYITGEGYGYQDKFHVGVNFPRDKRGQRTDDYVCGYNQPERPSINLSSSKTAEQIANDIKRRLLPAYLPLLAKAVELVVKWDAYENRRLAHFKAVMGRDPKSEYEQKRYEASFGDEQTHTFKASDDAVSLELNNITVEQALAVMKIVKGE